MPSRACGRPARGSTSRRTGGPRPGFASDRQTIASARPPERPATGPSRSSAKPRPPRAGHCFLIRRKRQPIPAPSGSRQDPKQRIDHRQSGQQPEHQGHDRQPGQGPIRGQLRILGIGDVNVRHARRMRSSRLKDQGSVVRSQGNSHHGGPRSDSVVLMWASSSLRRVAYLG